jgi:two-component system, NtrC family, response regulator HydG
MAVGDERDLRMGMGGLIGISAPMQRVYKLIRTFSAYQYPVLIVGEAGTGKGSVARVIHTCHRNDQTFASLSCATRTNVVNDLELFTHAPDPGGSRLQQNLFTFVGHGTLFVDEIAELPLRLQTQLLHMLEENATWPLSSTWPMPFNARVIASTNRNLAEHVRTGKFSEDLYLELAALQIDLPPLRDRKIDIPLLVDSFVDKYAVTGSSVRFTAAAMNYLRDYDWPGNVRELKDTVHRALSFASDPVSMDLRKELVSELTGANELLLVDELEIELEVIVRALRETGGDASAVARILGIKRSVLNRRLQFYGLEF